MILSLFRIQLLQNIGHNLCEFVSLSFGHFVSAHFQQLKSSVRLAKKVASNVSNYAVNELVFRRFNLLLFITVVVAGCRSIHFVLKLEST